MNALRILLLSLALCGSAFGGMQQLLLASGGASCNGLTFATWDPANKGSNITLSGANLIGTGNTDANVGLVISTFGKTSGKWYWEVAATNFLSGSTTNMQAGVINVQAGTNTYIGFVAGGWGYSAGNGNIYNNNVGSAYGNTYTTADVIGVAVDATAGKIWFAKNNTWQNSGNPAAGTNPAATGLSGTLYAAISSGNTGGNGDKWTANFGATTLAFTPPTGFTPGLCQ